MTQDMDESPAVAFESGIQEANREWRIKIYRNGGSEIIKELVNHYNAQHLIAEINRQIKLAEGEG